MTIDADTRKIERFKADTPIHIDSIYRFILYMVGNEYDAQDLVLDVYISAYKHFNDFEDETDIKVWLLKISKNVFMNYEYNTTLIQTDSILKNDDLEDDVAKAIYSLPIKYRMAVILVDAEGLSYRQSSEIIGCPMKTFISILYEGHQILREKLQNRLHNDICIDPSNYIRGVSIGNQ